jgi:hypothetical protein
MRRPEVGIIALAMLASACAFPTEAPNWAMTWNLPVPDDNAMNIGVSTFLPSGVTLVSSGTPATPTAFNAAVSTNPTISRTLGVQCPSCPNASAPKPAFVAPVASTPVTLSAGTSLQMAALTTGSQILVTVNNGFTFDPLNPPGGVNSATSSITIAVTNGSATLGTLTLGGLGTTITGAVATTIPAGQSKQFTIPLAGTINTAQTINITMTMDSPAGAAGSPVVMNPNQVFTATGVPTLNISTATVAIGAQALSSTATPIDLSQIDSSIVRRISNDTQNRGAMILTMTNPFTLGSNATITFQSPASASPKMTPITKNIVIPPATNATTPSVSTLTIDLTGQELRSLFGRDVDVVFGGTTSAGTISVTPTQKMTATSRIQVNFNIKEQ